MATMDYSKQSPFSAREAAYLAKIADPLITDATRLGKWRSGIANRNPRVLVIADSWGDGTGATSWQNAWIRRLAARLRADLFPSLVTNGGSYVQAGTFATSGSAPSVFALGGGATFQDYMGIGRRCAVFGSAAGTVTFSFTGTGCDLYYGTNGGASTFTYTVDGGAPQNVVTASTGFVTETPGNRVQIRGLASASHTIVCTATAAGINSYIEGVISFNGDETNGVHFFDCAKTNQGTKYWTTQNGRWLGQLPLIDPQLVIIALGINDFQEANQKVTSAAFKAAYQTLIADVRTVIPTVSIVLAVPPESGGVGLSPFSEFPDAIYQIASEDGNIALFDSRAVLGDTIASSNIWGYRADTYHINNAGHQAYADALYNVITRFP